MFSYFNLSTFNLGPLTIHTWGFVVSIGFGAALWVAYRRAKVQGLNGNTVLDIGFWILVGAFLGARLFHVFFYEWGYYRLHFNEIIRIDEGGLSSFGGFIGAAAAFWIYVHTVSFLSDRTKMIRTSFAWRYADVLMFAWPLGQGIGRIGCFLAHMHPGRLSNVPLAVQYPGGARLDMGLIESVGLLAYWVISSLALRKKSLGSGSYVIGGMIFYGVLRFTFDFFRAADLPMSDVRYFGLTPAQYGSAAFIVVGLILWKRFRRSR